MDFEAARETLVSDIARYCGITGKRAVIVFDGAGHGLDQSSPAKYDEFVIVKYSPKRLTADSVIERDVFMRRRESRENETVVVSADRGVREQCRAVGAIVMQPENFIIEMNETRQRAHEYVREHGSRVTRNYLEDRLDVNTRAQLMSLRDKL